MFLNATGQNISKGNGSFVVALYVAGIFQVLHCGIVHVVWFLKYMYTMLVCLHVHVCSGAHMFHLK